MASNITGRREGGRTWSTEERRLERLGRAQVPRYLLLFGSKLQQAFKLIQIVLQVDDNNLQAFHNILYTIDRVTSTIHYDSFFQL